MDFLKSFDLFPTEEAKNNAVNTLLNGKSSDFWKLIKKIVEANIEYLKEILITERDDNGQPYDEKSLIEARMMIQAYRSVIKTPEHFIFKFAGIDVKEESDDPYATIKDVKKENNEVSDEVESDLPPDFDTTAY